MENNGWGEYKREILYRLADLKEDIKDLCERIDSLENEMTNQRVKSGIWGALGASLPVALGIIWQIIGK